jgi:carboxymethylenebutenolidase
MNGYLARPDKQTRGGILVLHAWWGLNHFFRDFCNRLAADGFLAFAPDLYDGEIARTIPEAEKLRKKLNQRTAEAIIAEAVNQVQQDVNRKQIGLVGFSLGAYYALGLSQEKSDCLVGTVLFYGSRGGDYSETKSAFLGHYAETDPYVADSGRKKLEKNLKAAGREVVFFVYPKTRHWFFENGRPEYNPQAASLAWTRTLDFLHNHLD